VDGPASIAFTDVSPSGAVLDRNGLRPSRYYVTKRRTRHHGFGGRRPRRRAENVLQKGRLQPGRMFLVDLQQGRIIDDAELKHQIYREAVRAWLEEHLLRLEELPEGRSRTRRTS
jgi:glutamate synthase (ferredoxin)